MARPDDTCAADGAPSVLRESDAGVSTDVEEALWARLADARGLREFAAAWLALQCRAVTDARAGLLLLGASEDGPFSASAVWPEGTAPSPHLLDAAEQALSKRSALVLGGREEGGGTAAPRVAALPVESGGRLRGAVVVEVGAGCDRPARSLVHQLRWGCGWLDSLRRSEDAPARDGARERYETVLRLLASALEHERFRGAATALVTDVATEFDCDSVAVGLAHRGRIHLQALSHSAHFQKKTDLVRALEEAMEESFDQEATVVYPAPPAGLPPASQAHAELSRRLGADALCTVPLVQGERVCGALTLARTGDRPFDAPTVELLEVVSALAGPVLELHQRDDRWLPRKISDALGDHLRHLLGPRHVALKLATAAVVGLGLFLALATGDHRVTADTVLEPSVLTAATAPFEGYIAEAPARAGDLVEEGDVLASLDDRDLQLERLKWESQLGQSLKQYRQALAERSAADAEVLAAAVQEARAELSLIEDRLQRVVLRAPFDGVVVSGDLSQQLGSPVERGTVLFEVAPLDSYRIHVQVDETDIADVEVGQQGRLILSSLPHDPLDIVVEKITPVAEAEEGRNRFRVEARLLGEIEGLRPGIEGVAKIDVGERRLLWIWTHDAIDWLTLALWTWLP